MVDAFAGYDALFIAGATELACRAHIRRKFFDVRAANGALVTEEALRRISQLYAIEPQASACTTAGRRALREQHALPARENMHAWLLTSQQAIGVGSGTAKAIEQALAGAAALRQFGQPAHR